MYYALVAVLVLVVLGLWIRHQATRKLTLEQLKKKVHRLHAYYRRIHPEEPDFKIKLAVVTACLTSLDWETRRQMAHSSESLDQMAELIYRWQENTAFRSGPSGFGAGPGAPPPGAPHA